MESSRADFDNSIQTVIFEPSVSQLEETITINLVDDIINEAKEGFFAVIEVVEIGAADNQTLVLERNGVALVLITDNDRKLLRLLLCIQAAMDSWSLTIPYTACCM